MSDIGPDRALLEEVHDFPGPYTVKAIGPHDESFVKAIRAAAQAAHSGDNEPEISARVSAKGNHMSITATIHAAHSDDVFALYAALKKVDAIRMLL